MYKIYKYNVKYNDWNYMDTYEHIRSALLLQRTVEYCWGIPCKIVYSEAANFYLAANKYYY